MALFVAAICKIVVLYMHPRQRWLIKPEMYLYFHHLMRGLHGGVQA